MNTLCGICPPTNGTATIYGSPVAEIAEGSEMKQLVGICPQFNIIFDVLTVEEHLKIFAAIKGIPPADISAEVSARPGDLIRSGDPTEHVNISPLISLLFPGDPSAEGSGHGEDHDGPGQESERGPEEEAVCGHRHSR